MNKDSKIYIPGHTGLIGNAIYQKINCEYDSIFLDVKIKGKWFTVYKDFADYVFNCAAYTGGINEAINKPADMLLNNLTIQNEIIKHCYDFNIKKLLCFGSSCIYPINGKQPYTEDQIGTGKTDENWSYAVAKLAGIELCRAYHQQYGCNFISVIPCNIYGPNDKFDLERGHVIPALIRKFHEAKENGDDCVEIWGNGNPLREFLYVDDIAEACIYLMENYDYENLYDGIINVGSGKEISIKILIAILQDIIGYNGAVKFNIQKPQGVYSKLMDSSRVNKLGWYPKTNLEEGLEKTYEWFKIHSCGKSGYKGIRSRTDDTATNHIRKYAAC